MQEQNEFGQILGEKIIGWQVARRPDGSKVLQGSYCYLEPINVLKHGSALFHSLSLDNKGETWTYLPYGPFADEKDFCVWLEQVSQEQDTQLYAIFNKEHQALGIAGYLRINPQHGVIEVGHLHYSRQLQKTPVATEAMYLMMKYSFDELGYRRYEWKCNSLNEASKAAARRLGFSFEGVFRQCNIFKNRNRDTAWFSILDSEWPQLNSRFSKWLADSNFDNDGKQRQRLSEIS